MRSSSPDRRRAVVTGAALLLLAMVGACQPTVTASAPGTPTAAASPTPVGDSCPPLELRSPTGDAVNLNGTWATEKEGVRGGVYYFRQVGSCIWFVGAFPSPTDSDVPGALSYVTVAFHGQIGADFAIVGHWIDARDQFLDNPGAGGTLRLRVEFGSNGEVRLVYVDGQGQSFVEPDYREEQSWIKISDGGAYPPPP